MKKETGIYRLIAGSLLNSIKATFNSWLIVLFLLRPIDQQLHNFADIVIITFCNEDEISRFSFNIINESVPGIYFFADWCEYSIYLFTDLFSLFFTDLWGKADNDFLVHE